MEQDRVDANIDEDIIHALQRDGRVSYSELARDLGASRALVATRMRALLAKGHVRVVVTADPAFLEEHVIAHIAIAGRGELEEVISKLTERKDVPLVSATSGTHDLVAEMRARNNKSLYGTLAWLRKFPQVSAINVVLYTDILKGAFVSPYSAASKVDQLDIELIERLREGPRKSFSALAGEVNLSPTAVRNRVHRMRKERILTIGAVITHAGNNRRLKVGVGLNLNGNDEYVIGELTSYPEVEFASLSIGRFDVVATLNSGEPAEIFARLENIKALDGVTRMSTWFHLQTFKEDYSRSV